MTISSLSSAPTAAATEHAIDVRSLSRRFGEFVAVDDLSFTVARGEIFGFLGSNGAGRRPRATS